MQSVFNNPNEEKAYLEEVKKELDACDSERDVVELWKRHYLKIGHRKLGRLLLGKSPEQAMRRSGGVKERIVSEP